LSGAGGRAPPRLGGCPRLRPAFRGLAGRGAASFRRRAPVRRVPLASDKTGLAWPARRFSRVSDKSGLRAPKGRRSPASDG